MKVSSTELQNNFGKYLMLVAHEDIIITRNGTEIAKLTTMDNNKQDGDMVVSRVSENIPLYGYGKKATYEEFLELREKSDERYEYIDGEIYLLASPKIAHQYAVTKLLTSFSNFFEGTNCTPFVAPCDIELQKPSKQMNMVQPDLMVICDLEEHLGADDYYKGVPSLVVEVLSKSTARKDLIIKTDLYRDCGVIEYWIVNPENKQITIYHFEDQGIKNLNHFKENEVVQSFIFEELYFDVSKIFR